MAEVAVGAWSRLGKAWWVFTLRGALSTFWMLECAKRQCHVDAVKQMGRPGVLPIGSHQEEIFAEMLQEQRGFAGNQHLIIIRVVHEGIMEGRRWCFRVLLS